MGQGSKSEAQIREECYQKINEQFSIIRTLPQPEETPEEKARKEKALRFAKVIWDEFESGTCLQSVLMMVGDVYETWRKAKSTNV